MKPQNTRLPQGGCIDRNTPLTFSFDSKNYTGYQGDTLASALLANGIRIVGRSFKYHRPRGLLKHDSSEPNALVTLGRDNRREPNIPATIVQLHDGLEAWSQNRWPSLKFDLMSINNLISPLFAAGFYYKTFMWPRKFWTRIYEPIIRNAAGLGVAPAAPDPDYYEKATLHCDVLVVGAGVSGLMAAQTAAGSGCRVILCDENPDAGGAVLGEPVKINHQPAGKWVSGLISRLEQLENVNIKLNTTVFGWYDGNTFAAVERLAGHLAIPPDQLPRQRLWRIISKQAVIASGALERPLVFKNNDLPGVMMASSARYYIHRYAVMPGRTAIVFGNNDDIYHTAQCLLEAGLVIAAIVDTRAMRQTHSGFTCFYEHHITNVKGRLKVTGVSFRPIGGGEGQNIDCDLLVVSGGLDPAIQLAAQRGVKTVWDKQKLCFLPARLETGYCIITGAAAGEFDPESCIKYGQQAGSISAVKSGFPVKSFTEKFKVRDAPAMANIQPWWGEPVQAKAFVDFQHDVTQSDILLAHREGYESIEHIKRYTTLGMATDQGKSSNINALGILSARLDQPVSAIGTTTCRPPYTPVTLGALAGYFRTRTWRPLRKTPLHDFNSSNHAVFIDSGMWTRSRYFPATGETISEAVSREVSAVRQKAGLCDVSTLGKIDLQGVDASEFLNRVYCNGFKTLAVGKSRYGLMLREDGIVFDDGTVTRLDTHQYFVTTTTARAEEVLAHLEHCHQVLWPELRISIVDVTEDWAGIAVAGPLARELLQQLFKEADLTNSSLPPLSTVETSLEGIRGIRILRISFSGETGYEIYIPSDYGNWLAEKFKSIGKAAGLTLYGEDALDVLRIEKGHISSEITGSTSAGDLGLGQMMSTKKDYIGRVLSNRPGLIGKNRQTLVGLVSTNCSEPIICGSHLLDLDAKAVAENDLGYVTSSTWSPTRGRHIALGLVKNGRSRIGQTIKACDFLSNTITPVEIVSTPFYDPLGEKYHA